MFGKTKVENNCLGGLPNLVWDQTPRNYNMGIICLSTQGQFTHRDKVTLLLLIKRWGRKAHGLECYSRASNPPDVIVTNKKSHR